MATNIPKKELEKVRKQLIQQIEQTFPADKKEFAKSQVLSMNDEQLIDFLQKNRLLKVPDQASIPQQTMQSRQCVFCSIVRNEIDSYKIDENKDNIAVLEINPVSKGHVLVIPKQHIESSGKLPQNSFSLAKKITKKLKSKLKKPKPKEVQINASNIFGHEVVNVFPIYKDETLKSQRYQENKKVLEKLKKKLEKKTTKKKKPKKKKIQKKPGNTKETIRVPRRIP